MKVNAKTMLKRRIVRKILRIPEIKILISSNSKPSRVPKERTIMNANEEDTDEDADKDFSA